MFSALTGFYISSLVKMFCWVSRKKKKKLYPFTVSPLFAVLLFLAQTHQCGGSQGKASCPAKMLLVVPKTGWRALGRAGAQPRSPRERHKNTEGNQHRDTKFKLNTG